MLQQMATDITDEFNKDLNPDRRNCSTTPITDHGRNEVVVKDAVAHTLRTYKRSIQLSRRQSRELKH